LISIIQENEEKFWQWTSQNFVISIICESIIEDSYFKKYFRELLTNNLNLSINYLKNSYQIEQNRKPKMQNKLIDIILNSDLTKEDYYYLDLLTKLRSKNTYKKENKDKIFELLDEIDRNHKINDLIKVLVQEDVILALLEDKEYSEAIEICESNIKLIKNNLKDKSVKQYLQARTLQNQFRVEVKKQNFNQAEKYGNRVLDYYKHEKIRRKYDLLLFLIEYGTYYLEQREKYSLIYDKAINLLNNALEIAISKRNKDPEIFGKIFRSFAEINWRDGNYLDSLINSFKSECLFLVNNNVKKFSFDGLAKLYLKYLKGNGFEIGNIDWKTPWI
jgi:tetratricopeptide (TPR) repeat protein